MAVILLRAPGVLTLVSDIESRLLNGLIICVILDMARFSLRGVLLKENARLTRLPNLKMGLKKMSCEKKQSDHLWHAGDGLP